VGDQLYDQMSASELEIRGIIQKPIDPAGLLSMLKTSLGGS
jgi:AmiR/NasT family two-component response regulator